MEDTMDDQTQISAFRFVESLEPLSKDRIKRVYDKHFEGLDKDSLYIPVLPVGIKGRLVHLAHSKGMSVKTYVISILVAVTTNHAYYE
jgi:hypothetical protein